MHDVLLFGAAGCYVAAVLRLRASLLDPQRASRAWVVGLALAGAVLHAAAQVSHWMALHAADLSVLNALSLCAWVAVVLMLASTLTRHSLIDAALVVLPLATLIVLAEAVSDMPGTLLRDVTPAIATHIVSSVVAFGVLSIAGVYALFAALIDRFLRHHDLNPLVRSLPALDVLESLLFQLIAVGFAILTLSLATGLLFVSDLFEQHLAHKTILSITAWLIFGLLLWGRIARGWRGQVAVRMTVAGVIVLVLSYFGSKLVLEVILHRSWQG